MKLLILSVGKPKNPLYRSQIEVYHRRIEGSIPCLWHIVRESSGKKPREALMADEGAGILKMISDRDHFILLDAIGKSMTSVQFSRWLFDTMGSVPGRVVLGIGGPFGVAHQVRERADMTLSLSKMTIPHEMCLLLLFEQVYRAITIEKGGGYHH